MANYRATMLLQQSNAGWGESFFTNQASPSSVFTALQSLVNRRVACLGPGARVQAMRAQNVDGQGDASVRILNQLGTSSTVDTPWQSLIVHLKDEDGRRLIQLLRGIPDAQVEAGVFVPSPAYTARLRDYLDEVVAGPWTTRRLNRANPLKAVTGVSNTGMLTCLDGHGLVAGNKIKLLRVRDVAGNPVSGVFQVSEVLTTFTVQLANWQGQVVQGVGAYRKYEFVYKNITSYEYGNKITSRKVGRPFDTPRGRASRR